jgi:hypothetical protein
MLHPDTHIEYFNAEIGHGIVANTFLAKGTLIWCLDKLDRLLTQKQMRELDPLLFDSVFHFSYRNKYGEFVVPWDAARFMNHSYTPNCLLTPYDFEIAVRDIYPGEQLTCDYGTLNIVEAFEYSGAPAGRECVSPDDLLYFHSMWDEQIQDALRHFKGIHQPLLSLVNPDVQHKIQAILEGHKKAESILSLYYNPIPLPQVCNK